MYLIQIGMISLKELSGGRDISKGVVYMVLDLELMKTNSKSIIDATVNSIRLAALYDTGSDKAIWYGSAKELIQLGAKHKNDNGAFRGIGGSVQYNKPVYSANIKIYSCGRGITFQNVDIIVNDTVSKAGQFQLIIPYGLLHYFDIRLRPSSGKPGDFGRLQLNIPDNRVIYRVKQEADYSVSEVYAID